MYGYEVSESVRVVGRELKVARSPSSRAAASTRDGTSRSSAVPGTSSTGSSSPPTARSTPSATAATTATFWSTTTDERKLNAKLEKTKITHGCLFIVSSLFIFAVHISN